MRLVGRLVDDGSRIASASAKATKEALPFESGFTADAQLKAVLDSLPFYVLLVDSDHVIHFANKSACESLDMDLSDIRGKRCPMIVHGVENYPGCPLDDAVAGGLAEKTYYSSNDNAWLWMTAYPTGMMTDSGREVYFHMMRDVTAEMEIREAAVDNERKFHHLLQALEDTVFVMSTDGVIRDINQAGLDLLRISSKKVAKRFNLQKDIKQLNGWDEFYDILRFEGRVTDHEVSFGVSNGQVKTVLISASAVTDGSSDSGLIRVIMRDITHSKELEALSITDTLTALYNRRFFSARLDGQIRRIRAGESGDLSVLFLDIDDFKSYNDTFGHQDGDHVLRRVADSIRLALRDGDVAARYGGEEFAVILNCDSHVACEIGERIRLNVEVMCSKSADNQIRRDVTVSVGIATLGPGLRTAERLVGLADSRMYEAKQSGKNLVRGPRCADRV